MGAVSTTPCLYFLIIIKKHGESIYICGKSTIFVLTNQKLQFMNKTSILVLSLALCFTGINSINASDYPEQNRPIESNKNKTKEVVIKSLPTSLAELQAMDGADLKDEFKVAALVVATLCNYENDKEATFEMLDFLNGPTDMNTYTRQFIRERLEGKQYKTFSFFEGTSPKNNYQAKAPYKIQVSTNPYTYQDENYATLYLQSSGADNPRPIKLRKKPSTGQWFVVDYNFLADIRIPVEQDEWN